MPKRETKALAKLVIMKVTKEVSVSEMVSVEREFLISVFDKGQQPLGRQM